MDRSELVQLMPRQLSAIDYMQLVGDKADFTDAEAVEVRRQAEMIAIPGKVVVWDAVETACSLFAMNNCKHLTLKRSYPFPEVGLPQFLLTIEIKDARVEFGLSMRNNPNGRFDHELQHLAIPEKDARHIASSFLHCTRELIRCEEERVQRMQQYKPWTNVEELIAYLPRDLTIGKFMELIQDRKRFTPEEVEGIIQESANWADK
jgi:hypothetical protein